jgi:RNA polymerase primary sigma factor
VVRRTVEELPERERKVIKLRFGLNGDRDPLPLTQTGRQLGITAETVREVERRALQHLSLRRELEALREAALADEAGLPVQRAAQDVPQGALVGEG